MAKKSRIDHAEILTLKNRGFTNQEIAQRLGVSKNTVEYRLYPKD